MPADVVSSTCRLGCPAWRSKDRAWPGPVCAAGIRWRSPASKGAYRSFATRPWPPSTWLTHLVAVDHQPERLPHPDIVERRLVHTHGERVHAPDSETSTDAPAAFTSAIWFGGRLSIASTVPLKQRLDPGVVGREVEDHQFVHVRLVGAPVLVEPRERAHLARLERPEPERPGAHRARHVEADRHDRHVVLGKLVLEQHVRLGQRDPHGPCVDLAQPVHIDDSPAPPRQCPAGS